MTFSCPSFSAAVTSAAMSVEPPEVSDETFDQSTELPPPVELLLLLHPAAKTAVLAAARMAANALLLRTLNLSDLSDRGVRTRASSRGKVNQHGSCSNAGALGS
jgi:hypothetical protein